MLCGTPSPPTTWIQCKLCLPPRHAAAAGINVRKGATTDMLEENVVQPLLVSAGLEVARVPPMSTCPFLHGSWVSPVAPALA